jgi:hypothetical protein
VLLLQGLQHNWLDKVIRNTKTAAATVEAVQIGKENYPLQLLHLQVLLGGVEVSL